MPSFARVALALCLMPACGHHSSAATTASAPVRGGVPPIREVATHSPDPSVDPQHGEAAAETRADQVVRKLAELLAQERARRKLAPLTFDARLARLAHAHSVDMSEHRFIAHTSPTTGEPADRVLRADLTATVVLENIGRGYSASEIHEGLMNSPGHRANILNPDVRQLGIGVVTEDEGENLAFLATQLFAHLSRDVPVAEAPAFVGQRIAALRRAKHRNALTLDPRLAKAAGRAAQALAADPRADQNALLARAAALTPPKHAKGLGAMLLLAADLEQVVEAPSLLDPALGWLGIGVARSKVQTASPWVVVLVFATR